MRWPASLLSLGWVVRSQHSTADDQAPLLLVSRTAFDATAATVHVLPHHHLELEAHTGVTVDVDDLEDLHHHPQRLGAPAEGSLVMGVFVDDMLRHAAVRNGPRIVRGRWSHLMADTSDELREFASRLRLNPAWIQEPATVLEHYDVTAAVREHALRLGAVRIAYG